MDPYSCLKLEKDLNFQKLHCYHLRTLSMCPPDLTIQVSYKLNFTYMVRQPADGQWGIKEGGGWNGMIRSGQQVLEDRLGIHVLRQVMDKEVMLGAAAFTVSHERIQVAAVKEGFTTKQTNSEKVSY